METMVVASIVFWVIGLFPAFLLRFAVYKRRLSIKASLLWAFVIGIGIFALWFIVSDGRAKAQILIGVISYFVSRIKQESLKKTTEPTSLT